ncbi:MAG: polymer-forming cytoskeletal protein [Candidatus Cohnella colombiensis]|uniref:Polymer-forming cytoskeletal protein n=1 Tax=Candidatus Cohnella colombiensis TaxID=3121368 RepID=A0AA95JF92_9BACL|nr:MAG: polymer-forming cytoskeletal protein [Cohnella sp.]
MFKGKKSKIDPNSTDTLIGEGSIFEGNIKSEAGLRVEGKIFGNIDCTGDVTIGENGSARSHVSARNVIVAGKVTGDIHARGKLTIKTTGVLQGNLSATELSIESGGIFHGESKMQHSGQINDTIAENKAAQDDSDDKTQFTVGDESSAVLKTW